MIAQQNRAVDSLHQRLILEADLFAFQLHLPFDSQDQLSSSGRVALVP
jgi:hypothetical protein